MELREKFQDEKYRLKIIYDDSAESPREWYNIGTMVYSHRRYKLGDEEAQNTDDYNNWDEWLEGEVLEPNGGEDNVVFLPLYLFDHSGVTMNTTGFSCPWDSGQVGWIYATKEKFREETGYGEKELFSRDKNREPEVGELVKIKGYEDKGVHNGFGKTVDIVNRLITVDFDYGKFEEFKNPENVITFTLEEVAEVMSNKAEEMLRSEVEIFDDYLCGNVYGFVLEELIKCGEDCNECGDCEDEDAEGDQIDSCWGFYGTDWENNGIADHLGEHAYLLDL